MPTPDTMLVFALLSLGLAATPGPNMLYLVSRSLAQGTGAGIVSLAGCQAGSVLILLCAAAGITATLFAIPLAWDVLRLGGALYLLFLAWQCLRPGGAPVFAARAMPREPRLRLFSVGLATAALNPKVALFYVAVLPPFLDVERGNILAQSLVLGLIQVAVCTAFDAALVWGAAGVARFFNTRPGWMAAQRWIMGGALGLLAVKLAVAGER